MLANNAEQDSLMPLLNLDISESEEALGRQYLESPHRHAGIRGHDHHSEWRYR